MKRLDLSDQDIGFWHIGEAFRKENGKIYYHCTCICGKKKDVYGSLLHTGKSLSCGCMAKVTKDDLTGKDFGLLHVEEKLIINHHTYWRCSCKCGGSKIVLHRHLKDGSVKSCGCRGTFQDNVAKSLEKYCMNGTYLPGIQRETLNKNNTSGFRGVSYWKDRGKYRAYIKFQRKDIFLGNFDRIEDAVEARLIAEKEYFGEILDLEKPQKV